MKRLKDEVIFPLSIRDRKEPEFRHVEAKKGEYIKGVGIDPDAFLASFGYLGKFLSFFCRTSMIWWGRWDSNPRPPGLSLYGPEPGILTKLEHGPAFSSKEEPRVKITFFHSTRKPSADLSCLGRFHLACGLQLLQYSHFANGESALCNRPSM